MSLHQGTVGEGNLLPQGEAIRLEVYKPQHQEGWQQGSMAGNDKVIVIVTFFHNRSTV